MNDVKGTIWAGEDVKYNRSSVFLTSVKVVSDALDGIRSSFRKVLSVDGCKCYRLNISFFFLRKRQQMTDYIILNKKKQKIEQYNT